MSTEVTENKSFRKKPYMKNWILGFFDLKVANYLLCLCDVPPLYGQFVSKQQHVLKTGRTQRHKIAAFSLLDLYENAFVCLEIHLYGSIYTLSHCEILSKEKQKKGTFPIMIPEKHISWKHRECGSIFCDTDELMNCLNTKPCVGMMGRLARYIQTVHGILTEF